MYSVNNDYLTAMLSHATRRRLTGTIGAIPLQVMILSKDHLRSITGVLRKVI